MAWSTHLLVIGVQRNDFPQLGRQVGSFNSLHAKEQLPFFFPDGGVVAVGEGTGRLGAEASKVVLVAAKGLGGGSG